jgi:hypothetical protein
MVSKSIRVLRNKFNDLCEISMTLMTPDFLKLEASKVY